MSLEQYRAFLAKHGVKYTEGGLANLLQYANTSIELAASGKPIGCQAMVEAMSKVPEVPLYMTLLPPEQTANSPISRWKRGAQRIAAQQVVQNAGSSSG